MGLRGPQPTLKLRSERLEDLSPPQILGEDTVAADYWRRHAPQLVENQLLTASTADKFCVLCDLWQKWTELKGNGWSKEFDNCTKALQSWAKFFRLLPTEKPHVKEDRFSDFGEVEL